MVASKGAQYLRSKMQKHKSAISYYPTMHIKHVLDECKIVLFTEPKVIKKEFFYQTANYQKYLKNYDFFN